MVRVHPELLTPERTPSAGAQTWERRYREINDWERYLADNGIHIVKVDAEHVSSPGCAAG